MKEQMLALAIQMLLKLLTPDMLKKVADVMLDFVEDKVLGSASSVDDRIVLPICDMIRNTFDIPDND